MVSFSDGWGAKVAWLSIASNANEPLEMLKEVAKQRGVPLVLHDEDQTIARQYNALTTPHIFVLDGQGVLQYQGAYDDKTFRQPEPTRNYLTAAVDALLDGVVPDPAITDPYGCTVNYYRVDQALLGP
jgi:hypothetical protein